MVNPAVEPNRTWSVACRRDGNSAADNPAKGLVGRTADNQVDLDTADSAAGIQDNGHAAGTDHAAADSPGSGAQEPAGAERRDDPVALGLAGPDWVPFVLSTKSTVVVPLGVVQPHHDMLRPAAADSAAAVNEPDLWEAAH